MMENKRIKALEGLRVLALFIIVLSHLEFLEELDSPFAQFYNNYLHNPTLGVDYFFMLSGFGLMISYIRNPINISSFKDMLKFAWKKVGKLYLLVILTYIPGIIILIDAYSADGFSKMEYAQLFLKIVLPFTLLQSSMGMTVFSHSLNGVVWFFSSLFIIYMISPLAMKLIYRFKESKKVLIVGLVLNITIILILSFAFSFLDGKWKFDDFVYGSPYIRLFYVIIGMLLACLYSKFNKNIHLKKVVFSVFEISVILSCIVWFTFRNSVHWEIYYLRLIDIPLISVVLFIFSFEMGILSKILSSRFFIVQSKYVPYVYLIHYPIRITLIYYVSKYYSLSVSLAIIYVLSIILSTLLIAFIYRNVYAIIQKKIELRYSKRNLDNNQVKSSLISITKVASSNIIKLLSGVLVGFLLPRIIGVTSYGFYKTFTLYSTYVGLFAFGFIDGIYLIYGAIDYENLEKKKFRLFSIVLFSFEFILSIVLAMIALFVMQGELRFIFVCLSIYMFTKIVIGYYQIISQVTGRFSELSFRNIIESILTCIAVLALWIIKEFYDYEITYRYYTIIFVIIYLFLAMWYVITYRKITFGKKENLRENIPLIKKLIKVGFPLMIANLCSSFILTIDRQFVNILFDTDTYAVYAFAYNMLGLITTAMAAISTVLYPTLKRTDIKRVNETYSFLVSIVLILVATCLMVYFPLFWFVNWFLPKYSESLIIFRIILPGLAVSSVVTIIMHNYYKILGMNISFFVKSIVILVLSGIANYVSYLIWKSTISISISSICIMILWYFIIDYPFFKKDKVLCIKNLSYLVSISTIFYLITIIDCWWLGLIVYVFSYGITTVAFYFRTITKAKNVLFHKVSSKKTKDLDNNGVRSEDIEDILQNTCNENEVLQDQNSINNEVTKI